MPRTARLPLSTTRIREVGLKATSLEYLRDHGLYTLPMLLVRSLPSFADFSAQMKAVGFRAGADQMAIRFSPYKVAHYQPRFWGAKTFRAVYRYLEQSRYNFKKGAFLVVPSIMPRYMASLYVQPNRTLYVEVVPGTWMTSAVSPSDRITLRPDGTVTVEAYQQRRTVLSRWDTRRKKFRPWQDDPLAASEIRRLASAFWKLGQQVWPLPLQKLLLEIQIVAPLRVEVREIKTDPITIEQRVGRAAVYELNRYEDFEAWDRKQPLLVNVPADKFHEDQFFALLKRLPRYSKRVFIRYGMLTHPAILLREAGIETMPYRETYKKFSFRFRRLKKR